MPYLSFNEIKLLYNVLNSPLTVSSDTTLDAVRGRRDIFASGDITINLPLASEDANCEFVIFNSGSGVVTVQVQDTDKLNDSNEVKLSAGQSVHVKTNGVGLWVCVNFVSV